MHGVRPAGSDAYKPGAIVYALAALKNIGAAAMETIVAERNANGPFKDLSDFAGRINPKVLNKRAIEMLASAGALRKARAQPRARPRQRRCHPERGRQARRARDRAASSTCSARWRETTRRRASSSSSAPRACGRRWNGWTWSSSAVGYFLSGHPLDEYESALASLGVKRYAEFAAGITGSGSARIAAIVVAARERRSAKGNKFAFGDVLRRQRPVRGDHLLRHAHRLARSARGRHRRVALRRRRARRCRNLEVARRRHRQPRPRRSATSTRNCASCWTFDCIPPAPRHGDGRVALAPAARPRRDPLHRPVPRRIARSSWRSPAATTSPPRAAAFSRPCPA